MPTILASSEIVNSLSDDGRAGRKTIDGMTFSYSTPPKAVIGGFFINPDEDVIVTLDPDLTSEQIQSLCQALNGAVINI